MRKQSGFTLVELVIVIVILGILAATALPRFVNLTSNARTAAAQGLAGGMSAAATVVQAQYMAAGTSPTSISMSDGTTVTLYTNGYPDGSSSGIAAAIQSTTGFNFTTPGTVHGGGTATFQPQNGGSATCQVVYDPTKGAATATTSGC